jgi:hypothetical protein
MAGFGRPAAIHFSAAICAWVSQFRECDTDAIIVFDDAISANVL